tara:strand:+ start:311 stop:655 length:345 start_codon:yes stop_codon:yes gene_type:complete
MIDYLLKFPDKDTAVAFGVSTGYTVVDGNGEAQTVTSTRDYCLAIIGESMVLTGEIESSPFGDRPIREPDGKHWVLFRDIKGSLEVPSGADQYIAWRSDSGEDRPTDAPDRVFA